MKIITYVGLHVAICLFVIVIVSSCTSRHHDPLFEVPSVDAIFDELAIEIQPSNSRVYAYTDKVGGFWQGRTYCYNRLEGGYNIEDSNLLRDFYVVANDSLLDRSTARRVDIVPHQAVHHWNDGFAEKITVLHQEHGLIISLQSRRPVRWTFYPVFASEMSKFYVEHDHRSGLLIVADMSSKRFWAIKSSVASRWSESADGVNRHPGTKDELQGQFLHRNETEETASLHYIVLYGTDKDQLRRRIDEIVKDAGNLIEKKKEVIGRLLQESYFKTNDSDYDKALHWAKISGSALVVDQFGKGIWAGLPWFNQSWGRDTFIALPGIALVTGQFDDAARVIESFADYQLQESEHRLYGRIPNRVASPDDMIYNTTDGTPWMIREIAEYIFHTGDLSFARKMFPVIERAVEGSLKNFVDEHRLLTHDDADTWMDARIRGQEAWSPRGDRAVEIQALWYNQLRVGAVIANLLGHHKKAGSWNMMADTARANFNKLFIDPANNTLYDHLNADGTPDRQIRPNQLFAVTIPQTDYLIEPAIGSAVVRQVVSELTYPYGIASLSQNDAYFHPYHHDQIYHFDAAYHNGLCWHWNAGPVVSAMTRFGYQELAFRLTRHLADQILHVGMPGSLSELVEPQLNDDGSVKPSGTYSQAWSVSEFVRNFYQDYLGIHVNMLNRSVIIAPKLPGALDHVEFVYNFGEDEQVQCMFEQSGSSRLYVFQGSNLDEDINITLKLAGMDYTIYETSFRLNKKDRVIINWSDISNHRVSIDGRIVALQETGVVLPVRDPDLSFQTFRLNPYLKCLQIQNYLEQIRINEGQNWRPVD